MSWADYEKGCHLPLLHCRPASSCSLSEGTGELRRSGLALSNKTFLDDGNVWCLYFHHSRPLTVRGCWANEMWLLQLRNCIFDFIYLLSRLLYRTAQFGTLRHHPWSWNLCVLEVNWQSRSSFVERCGRVGSELSLVIDAPSVSREPNRGKEGLHDLPSISRFPAGEWQDRNPASNALFSTLLSFIMYWSKPMWNFTSVQKYILPNIASKLKVLWPPSHSRSPPSPLEVIMVWSLWSTSFYTFSYCIYVNTFSIEKNTQFLQYPYFSTNCFSLPTVCLRPFWISSWISTF